MLYVRYLFLFGLTVLVGCSSQTSDDESNVSTTAPASLQISPTPHDYGYIAKDTTGSTLLTLTNVGSFNASTFIQVGTSGPFRFTGADFPGDAGSCGLIIAPATSCTVEVEFAPVTLDNFDESFDIQYFDGEVNKVVSANLLGDSIIPAVAPTLLTLNDPAVSPANDATPEVTVSGGDISNGQTVRLYTDNTCTTLVATGVATGTSIDLTSSALTDGTYDFYATTTNSFASTSTCSTATVNYVLDLTAPNPQTIITHSATHNNTTSSPLISWTLSTSTDVANQQIAISTSAAGGNEVAGFDVINNSLNNYTFSALSLAECTNYYATLYATDDVGNDSIYAVSATPFQVDANNPTDPSGISLSGTPTFIKAKTFNFTASTDTCGVASYEMAIGTTNTGAGVNNTMNWLDVGTPSGSYTLESGVAGASFNLFKAQNYYISIRAKDTFGNYSNIVTSTSFTVDPTITLSMDQAYPDKIDLSWTAPITSGITDYHIYYKLSSDSTYSLFTDGVSTALSTTVTGLITTSSYDFYIHAIKGAVDVEYSNTLTESTIAAPDAPTSLVLKDPLTSPSNDDTPEVTISGGDVANGFIVRMFTDNTCTTVVATGTATGSSIDLTAAPALAEGSYTFYANLTDTFGYSSACSTASLAYEVDLTNPEPPTGITHAPLHGDITTSPNITWTLSTSTDIANQHIGLSTLPTGGNDVAGFNSLTSTDTSYDFTALSLTECTNYYATVYAEDAAGNISTYGVSSTPFQVDGTNPTDPSGLSLSGTPTFIKAKTLNFTDSTDSCGAVTYEVAIGTTGSGAGVNDTMDWLNVGAQTGSYTLENGVDGAAFNLTNGQNYFISIRATDTAGLTSNVVTSAVFVVDPTFTLAMAQEYPDKIDLSWTIPLTSGITDYDIYYKISTDPTYTLFADGVSTSLATTLTGLANSTSYDIYIIVKVGTTNVEYSNTITQMTTSAPDAPTTLTLKDPNTSPGSDTTPEVTISGGSVANGVTVRMFTDNTCATQVAIGTSSGTSIDVTVAPALAEGIYNFYANLTDTFGYTSSCSTANVTYEIDTTNPNPPTGITHVPLHNNTATSPSISWTLSTSTDIANQHIGLSTLPTGGNDVAGFNSLTSTDTSYDFTALSLTECTNYYATVYAEDAAGNVSTYGVSSTPFQVDGTNPTDPSGLSLSGTPTFIKAKTLNFTDSTDSCGAVTYEVAIGTTGAGAGVNDTMDWLDVGAQTGSYTLENGVDGAAFNLIYGQNYYISIRANDTAGLTSNVVTSAAFVIDPTFTLSMDQEYPDKIDLSWTTPITAGITDYDIYYKLSADPTYTLFADGVSTGLTTTVTGLTTGTSYDFYIIAKVAATNVEYSNTITQVTATSPDAPTLLTLKDPNISPSTDTTPEVTISGGSIVNGATVRMFTDNTCTTQIASGTSTGTSIDVTVTPALTEGTYTFYANLTDVLGYTSPCSTANVNYEIDTTNPNPPTGITHVPLHNNTATSPSISWTLSTSTDIANQHIGLSTLPAGGNDVAGFNSLTSTDTSYDFTALSLTECTSYYATVYAEDAAGNVSTYGVSSTPFQVDGTNPTDPSGLSLSGTPTFIKAKTLNFTDSTDSCGAVTYEVAIGTTGSGAGVNDTMGWLDVGAQTGSYTLENGVDGAAFNLIYGQNYYISIRANDTAGLTSNVVTSAAFVIDPTFTLSMDQEYPDKIDLSWTTPITAGITDYDIYYKLSADPTYTLFADGVSTGLTTTVTGLTNGTSYDFYIIAKVAATNVEYSNTITQITATSPDAPTLLTLKDPNISPDTDTTPEVTISGGSIVNGVTVRMFTDNTCTTQVATGTATATSIDLTVSPALTEGTYTFYANLTDVLGYTSPCSTANVNYEIDTTNPNPPTGITHLPLHTDVTTSPAISWTLSSSADIAGQYIGLSTLPAGGNDVAGFNALTNTDTSYTFTAQSLTECIDYYATVYAEDTAGNVSTYGVSGTPFQVDASNPTAVTGLSLTGSATIVAAPTLNWSGASTDACGVSHYEVAIGTSNTGAGVNNIVDFTNVGNPAGSYTVTNGVDGVSLNMAPGTNYYVSVRTVDINGNISNISTSAAFILNSTFILGLDERLSTSLKVSWNLPSTAGVTDYDIFYKLSSAPTYTQFVDGVSTARFSEITGLTAATEYDVYIIAKAGGTNVEISNTITESTGPNNPFFNANYAAANVGGATGCRVIAYDDGGTLIKRNGVTLTTLANAGDTFDFTCAQHDLLESDNPFYVNGTRGSANISWASKGFSGKEYVFDYSRTSQQRLHIFAFEAATVQVFRGATLITTQVLAANTGTATPISITTYGSYKIISDGLIIAFKDGNVNSDPMVLSPATQEIIGFPSNSARFGVYNTGVSILSSYGTGTPTTATYNEGTSYSFASTGSLYSGSAHKLTGTMGHKIGANSYADSNGSCSASYASTAKFFKRYILPGNSEWVAIAATEAMSIEIVNAATGVVESTTALTGSAANGVYYRRFTNTTAGRIFRAADPSKKFAMWWEPKSTTSYMYNDDESIMWGSND